MIIALIGLSGVGKTHMVQQLMQHLKMNVDQLIAATTREPRRNEENGKDKYFLTDEEFINKQEEMICVHRMYGARYGFFRSELEIGNLMTSHKVVELYFSDYLHLKRMNFNVFGIHLYTNDRKRRRDILQSRYQDKRMYYRRLISDWFCSIALMLLDGFRIFDVKVLNQYDAESEKRLLQIVEETCVLYR